MAIFFPKIKNQNSKLENEMILKVFNHQKWDKKISKILPNSIVGFQCVAKNIEGWLKFCTSYAN